MNALFILLSDIICIFMVFSWKYFQFMLVIKTEYNFSLIMNLIDYIFIVIIVTSYIATQYCTIYAYLN